MTDKRFEKLIEDLKNGENQLLDDLFVTHNTYCITWLIKKYQCSRADAEDIFMEALLAFRVEALKDRVSNTNIQGYLVTIASRIYLNSLRTNKKKPQLPLDIDAVDYHLGKKEGIYNDSFNPLIKIENEAHLSNEQKNKVEAYKNAWQQLGKPCQALLKGFYIDKIKLKDLQKQLGYSTYDTVKSIRRRCFNQLKSIALKMIQQ